MITDMRKQLKSPAYRTFLFLIVGSFVMSIIVPILYQTTRDRADRWALKIDGHSIDARKFAHEFSMQRERINAIRAQYGQYADALFASMGMPLNPQFLAQQSLIRRTLLKDNAEKLGFSINPAYLADVIGDQRFITREFGFQLPSSIINAQGNVDEKVLHAALKRYGYSVHGFEADLIDHSMAKMSLDTINSALYVPKFAIERAFSREYVPKTFSVITINKDALVDEIKKESFSHDELQAYYTEQNKQRNRYWVPEKRAGFKWIFNPQTYGIEVSDEEIRSYYDDHKTKEFLKTPSKVQIRTIVFNVPSEEQAAAVYARAQDIRSQAMKDPSQFAELAKKYSEDKDTADKGGLVDYFTLKDAHPARGQTAFLLSKDGDISEIIQTNNGFEIIQRVGRKKPVYTSLEEARTNIAKKLTEQKFAQAFVVDMKAILQKLLHEREAALEELIKRKGGKKQDVALQAKDKNTVSQSLFRLDKDDVTYLTEGKSGVALKLTTVQKRFLPSFESIKDTVKQDLIESRAHKRMRDELDTLKQQAQAAKGFEKVKPAYAEYKVIGPVASTDEKKVEELKKSGLPVDEMFALSTVGSMTTSASDEAGHLIGLLGKKEVSKELFQEKQKEIRDKLVGESSRLLIEGFVASLYRTATIETNEFITNLGE